jgi:hypothetical protein
MQQVLRTLTPISWRDVFEPQVPAVVCSIGLIALVSTGGVILERIAPDSPLWVGLAAQGILGGLFYTAFMWFAPFPELRTLVEDTLSSIAPRLARFTRRTA